MGSSQSNEACMSREADSEGHRYWAEFEESPFDEGVSRYAYRGTLHGSGPKGGNKCVVKVLKKEYARSSAQWTVDIATSKRAQELAEEWNTTMQTNRPAHFRVPIIAKMDKRCAFNVLGFIPWGSSDATSKIGQNEYT